MPRRYHARRRTTAINDLSSRCYRSTNACFATMRARVRSLHRSTASVLAYSAASTESVKMWFAPVPRKFEGGPVVESVTVGSWYQ